MRPPARITQEVVDRIKELIPLFETLKEVADAANVRADVVWCVKHDKYEISEKGNKVKATNEDCFSWSEYPKGLY